MNSSEDWKQAGIDTAKKVVKKTMLIVGGCIVAKGIFQLGNYYGTTATILYAKKLGVDIMDAYLEEKKGETK